MYQMFDSFRNLAKWSNISQKWEEFYFPCRSLLFVFGLFLQYSQEFTSDEGIEWHGFKRLNKQQNLKILLLVYFIKSSPTTENTFLKETDIWQYYFISSVQ